LYFCAGGEIGGCGEKSVGRDGTDLGRTTGDAVDAPGDGSVGRISDGGGESECVAEKDRAGIGGDGDGDLRGGGVVEPPLGPLAQAARQSPVARRENVRAVRRRMRSLRVEESCFERVCERGRMEMAIADEGPAKKRRSAEAGA
jgi:hypothetical protein